MYFWEWAGRGPEDSACAGEQTIKLRAGLFDGGCGARPAQPTPVATGTGQLGHPSRGHHSPNGRGPRRETQAASHLGMQPASHPSSSRQDATITTFPSPPSHPTNDAPEHHDSPGSLGPHGCTIVFSFLPRGDGGRETRETHLSSRSNARRPPVAPSLLAEPPGSTPPKTPRSWENKRVTQPFGDWMGPT